MNDSKLIIFASLALNLLSIGCGRPHGMVESAELSAISSAPSDGAAWDLKNFEYNLDKAALTSVAQRVGCETAANWLAQPTSGSLNSLIQGLYSAANVYDYLQTNFWNTSKIKAECSDVGQVKSNVDGIKHLLSLAQSRGHGLTVLVVGGFGSDSEPTDSINASHKLWDDVAATLSAGTLRTWRIECTNSYGPDDACAEDLITGIAKNEIREPSTIPQEYLIWAYSKGGNTAIHALGTSPALRNKTLALITVAAPIGGGVAALVPDYLQRAAKAISQDPANFNKPITADDIGNRSLRTIFEGAQLLRPEVRQLLFEAWLKQQDFRKDDGSSVAVFHLASSLDIARLDDVIPNLTVEGDALALKNSSQSADRTTELLGLPAMTDYPISDAAVALEHSVIPKSLHPLGLDTHLLGVLRYDHLAWREQKELQLNSDNATGIPQVEITDGLLDQVATQLEGSAR